MVTESGRPVTTTACGFDLCTNMYNFTAFAVTSIGPGEKSAVIIYHPSEWAMFVCVELHA